MAEYHIATHYGPGISSKFVVRHRWDTAGEAFIAAVQAQIDCGDRDTETGWRAYNAIPGALDAFLRTRELPAPQRKPAIVEIRGVTILLERVA